MDYGIFNVCTNVNVCDCTRGCTDTVRESALKVDFERKIPLKLRGIEPASAPCRSDVLSTELHPPPLRLVFLSAAFRQYLCHTLFLVCKKYRICPPTLSPQEKRIAFGSTTKYKLFNNTLLFPFATAIHATKTKIA